MTAVEVWHNEALGMEVCAALERNGFTAHYVATGAEAMEMVASSVQPGHDRRLRRLHEPQGYRGAREGSSARR